jgi:uncharacterized protein YkuJ
MRIAAILSLFVFSGVVLAEDKKTADDKKPVGTWVKKAEGFELKFTFKKDNVFVFDMSNGSDGCTMESKCTFEKDGTVKCEVTKFEKKGNFDAAKEVGYKFSFKFDAKDKKATVSKIEGNDIDDQAKALVEGEYEKSAD